MSKDYQDRILDACLEETLGGMAPPDVSDRVAAAFTDQPSNGSGAATHRSKRRVQDLLPPSALSGAAPTNHEPPVHRNVVTQRTGRRLQSTSWSHVTLAVTLLAVACGVSYAFYRLAKVNAPQQDLAEQPSSPSEEQPLAPLQQDKVVEKPFPKQRPKRPATELANQQPRGAKSPATTPTRPTKSPATPKPETSPNLPAFVRTPANLPAALSDHEVIVKIDTSLASVWEASGIESVEAADDQDFCQRTYARLLGRPPVASEVQTFLADRSPAKRHSLIDQLVGSPEFTSHWGALLADNLTGVGADRSADPMALRQLISKALSQDVPYDELAVSLITATGSNDAEQDDYNPATNYLLAHAGKDTLETTSQVSRHFLGQRVGCVQCHDSMVEGNDWQQQRFWGLDSFLRQMVVQRSGQSKTATITDKDFPGEGQTPAEAEIYFSQMNGVLQVAFPQFIDGTQINASGFVADVNRRHEFAKLLVASPAFREASVNRIWAELMGVGLSTPVDDMGPHNPPAHPALLKELGEQFAAHDFQISTFVAWVAKSKAFGLQEATKRLPAKTAQLFASYSPPRQMPTSLEQSLALFAKARGGSQLTEQDQQQIGRLIGPTTPSTGGSNLQIIDGDMAFLDVLGPMQATIADEAFDSVTRRVVYGSMSPQEKVEHLFQYRLGRPPSRRELQYAGKLLGEEDSDSGFRVLSWTLRNTQESP